MPDQAEKLRHLRLVRGRGQTESGGERSGRGRRPRLRSIAITSGKGGVGKTSLVTNLAIAFARHGQRVLLVDGDLSLANVDLLLGLAPRKNMGDVILGEASIEDVVIKTPDGVLLLPAASGVEELADLDDLRRERLLHDLSRLEARANLLLLDTGSGIGRQTVHLARAASRVLVVTTPEPTAFSDAYAMIKVLSHGRLLQPPGLVVNMVQNGDEGRETARRIRAVASRFLSIKPDYLGDIPYDDAVPRSVRQQEPVLKIFPHCPAAQSIEQLAIRLLEEPEPPEPEEAEPEGYFLKVANR